ncbi:hypothetical protein AgCh_032295 [Apium graveolens]
MVRATTRGRIGRSLPERRRLELIKNYDWEILYHSGKANVVADALSKKERLKMIMSLGKFIRDFEKMEIEVKDDPDYGQEEGMFRLRKQKSSKERRPETGVPDEGFKDNLRGLTRRKGMDSIWLAIKIPRKTNDYRRTKLSKMEAARDEVVPSMVDEVIERKMLGPEVVQWTKDIVDLIRRWMTTTPGWIKEIDMMNRFKLPIREWIGNVPQFPVGVDAVVAEYAVDDCLLRIRINEGPHKPTKLSVVVAGEPAKSIPKEKSDYTAEDISSIAKDAKVRHLLHSAIDNVMSNRVINCKTAKEIWDALETRCNGTDSIKKNRKTILTQEYKHFDSKSNESLTALPESWDLKATIIRDNYNLEETTLDEIYGMLKTHELDMEQRSKRNGRKSRIVDLKAEEESPKAAASRKGKGKALITKSDTELSSSDSDDDSETESLPEMDVDEEMMKLCALMKSEGKGGKSHRGDYSNVKCYNCGEKDHISPDCKKVKSDKGKALVTKKERWTDTSDSESEVNYALMANADSSSDAAELKVPQTTYAFHIDDITELRRYLKTMFISYRDQTLTCERLTSENLAYKKRNDYLEKELVLFHQTQKDRDDAFYVRDEVLKMNESPKMSYGDDKNDKGTVEIEPIVVKQKPKDKLTEVNIGLMTKKQLKHKLKDVKNVNKVKPPRKNRNGKEGVNKSNDYKPVPNAPRKKCYNYGNSNHLASFYKKNKNTNSLPSKSGVKSQSVRYRPQNPCFQCGSLWHSIYTCKEYHSLYYDYYQIKPSLKKVSIIPSSVSSDTKSDTVNADKKNVNINFDAKFAGNRKNILVLDSGCSRHMIGNKALLSEKAGPSVSYGDGNIGKTPGYGNINLGNVIIEKVALVSGLKHNL